jgi:hypothetical protein
MNDLSFTPCSNNCPAVTGELYGSVKYCPMLENDRHKKLDDRIKANPGIFDFSDPEYSDCCLNFQCCPGSVVFSSILGRSLIIQPHTDRACEICNMITECRPYGKNGKWICFLCGMKDESATAANYAKSTKDLAE